MYQGRQTPHLRGLPKQADTVQTFMKETRQARSTADSSTGKVLTINATQCDPAVYISQDSKSTRTCFLLTQHINR